MGSRHRFSIRCLVDRFSHHSWILSFGDLGFWLLAVLSVLEYINRVGVVFNQFNVCSAYIRLGLWPLLLFILVSNLNRWSEESTVIACCGLCKN
jgi:hypothetical protein